MSNSAIKAEVRLPKGYRYLKANEIIKSGDLYLSMSMGLWIRGDVLNGTRANSLVGPWIRLKEKPRKKTIIYGKA